ncbi:hypothetical protein [Neobacillus sp. D3-1R]|uniref:hypothetical protein n=1 Tax=Neobacillus sp. D3-1R TaxID=3445778 RepID=UPI003FA1678A
MKREIIEQLQEVFPAQWFPNPIKGHKELGWFLLEINPLPPLDELELVVADIIKDITVDVSWGKVYHSNGCNWKHSIPQLVKKVIGNLEDQKFLVAVYPGKPGILGGQPIAVAIEPQINYVLYPDHPHLNVGHYTPHLNGKNFFIPDSFCYTDDPSKLGSDTYERLLTAFCKISVWLFRHQVWLETRKIMTQGLWIGLEGKPLLPNEYPLFLNPSGMCRCGSKKIYMDCHMHSDLDKEAKVLANSSKKNADIIKRQLIFKYATSWNNTKGIPQNEMLNQFKKSMIV